jgi:hypothetical protein
MSTTAARRPGASLVTDPWIPIDCSQPHNHFATEHRGERSITDGVGRWTPARISAKPPPMRKSGLAFWVLMFMWSLTVAACGGGSSKPDSIRIDPADVDVAFGAEVVVHALAVRGTDVNDAGPDVTWRSLDATKVQVTGNADGSATVKGLLPGTAMIEATLDDLTATATVTVGAAPIASIGITPPNPSLAKGTTVQLTATAMFGDATTADITDTATWSSVNNNVATVAADGTVRGVAVGSTMIKAVKDGVTGTTNVTITAATLVSIAVTPTNPTVVKGRTVALTATGTFTDNSTQNLGAMVTWSSANDALVSVTAAGVAKGEAVGTAAVTATLGALSGATDVTVSPATLVSLAVTPTMPSVAKGLVQQFTATGTYTDGTTGNLTTSVVWTSSNQVIASISNAAGTNGQATAVDPGSSLITATMGAFSDSTTMTVTPAVLASIAITPTNPSVPKGRTRQFTAMGTFTDATVVDMTNTVGWASSDETKATISNAAGSRGLATAANPGPTTISATFGLMSTTTVMTVTPADLVSIGVTPVNPSIAKGRTQQFVATGTFSDTTTANITDTVTWTSTVPANASISNAAGSRGLATGLLVGSTQIRATSGAISGTTNLTVTDAVLVSINVTPAAPSVAKGRTQQFTATGTFSDASTVDLTGTVLWSTTAPAIATISNAAGSRGLATTLAVGPTDVVATSGAVTGSTTLTVTAAVLVAIDITPALPTVSSGRDLSLTAIGRFSDASTQDLTETATWASSVETVATVSNAPGLRGVVHGVAAGTSHITATSGAIVGGVDLEVSDATLESIELTPIDPSVAAGRTQAFTATGLYSDSTTADVTAQVTWSSSDETVASISNAPGSIGVATSFIPGSVDITATAGALTATTTLTVTNAELVSIEVAPNGNQLAAGFDLQFSATGTFSDGSTSDLTTQVTWSSSDDNLATVSNAIEVQGLAHGLSAGNVIISAELDGVTGSANLEITAAVLVEIDLDPIGPSVAALLDQQFQATGTYSDGSTLTITDQVTWTSSDDNIATISNAPGSNGLATGQTIGQVTITAELGGVTGSTDLFVIAPLLTSIEVSPANITLAVGVAQPYVAMGTYENGEVLDISGAVTWASSDQEVATISNAAEDVGVAIGQGAGDTTISATLDGVTGQTNLHVTDAVVVSIEITPVTSQLALGRTLAYTAQAVYSDESILDVTTQAGWSSADPLVATVSNAPGTEGTAQALAVGTTIISASFGGVDGHADLEVTAAALETITIEPLDNPALPVGLTRDYTATGHYSDATVADITTQVTWESSNEAVLAISNLPGNQGHATAVAVGTVNVTATLDGIVGSTSTEVTAAIVQSIAVSPALPTVPLGLDQQFTATGTYSDLSVVDITSAVVWTSSDLGVASISNAPGTNGLADTVAIGAATITATLDGVSGSTDLTVNAAQLLRIEVTPTLPSVALGRSVAFVATGVFTDDSTIPLTVDALWASSDNGVATISNLAPDNGKASSVAPGVATISATFDGVTGTTDLTVTPVALESITIDPVAPTVIAGRDLPLTATGHYSDDSTAVITADVTWSTAAAAVATVSNVAGTQGQLHGVAAGGTTVTASKDGIEATVPVVVSAAVLELVAVTPDPGSVPKGRTLQMKAEGLYSDGTIVDITDSVTWSSEIPNVLNVSNLAPRGVVTGFNVDIGIVRATDLDSGLFDEVLVEITDAVLDSVVVAPSPTAIGVGQTRQFTATGTYSDLSVRNITNDVDTLWSTSDAAIATVSNAAGGKGLATGVVLGGPVTITAAQAGKSGTAQLTVAAAPTVTVTPANAAPAVLVTSNIVVTFSVAALPATVTTQSAAGPCTGSVQVSIDGFASCIGLGAPSFNGANTIATITPIPTLSYGRVYKVKVTTAAQSAGGIPLGAEFVQAAGFTTALARPCGTGLIISQVYGGGGNSGAPFNDFIELHNTSSVADIGHGRARSCSSARLRGCRGVGRPSRCRSPPCRPVGTTWFRRQRERGPTVSRCPAPDFVPAAPGRRTCPVPPARLPLPTSSPRCPPSRARSTTSWTSWASVRPQTATKAELRHSGAEQHDERRALERWMCRWQQQQPRFRGRQPADPAQLGDPGRALRLHRERDRPPLGDGLLQHPAPAVDHDQRQRPDRRHLHPGVRGQRDPWRGPGRGHRLPDRLRPADGQPRDHPGRLHVGQRRVQRPGGRQRRAQGQADGAGRRLVQVRVALHQGRDPLDLLRPERRRLQHRSGGVVLRSAAARFTHRQPVAKLSPRGAYAPR